MGGLGQGEHYHPDGSFHSWSGVQFTGRKADVDVETGKIAPSSKGFKHQNVDTWAHPDAGREMNKRAQEEAYKRSLGLEMGGGTGYDASGLPNRRRTIEKYAPDAEFGLFSGSEQAPLPNAGAIASMGANGTGQSVYDEGMFDQPAEAYGIPHPNQPSMVPAMQETPLETSYQGLQSMEGRTGHFDTTHVPKYAGDEPSFIAAGNTDADKAAAFAARESRGGTGAEITHEQYREGTPYTLLEQRDMALEQEGQFMDSGSMQSQRDKEAYHDRRNRYRNNDMSPREMYEFKQSGEYDDMIMEQRTQGREERAEKSAEEAAATVAANEAMQEDMFDTGSVAPPARGGGHFDTLTGEWVPTTRSTDVVTDPMGTAVQTSKNEQYRSGLGDADDIVTQRLDEAEAQSEQEAGPSSTTAAPSILAGGDFSADPNTVKKLLEKESDDALAADKAAMDADEKMTREQLDAFQKKYDAMSGDLPEGYNPDFFNQNPNLRKHGFDEKKYGELVGDLEKNFRTPESTAFFDSLKADIADRKAEFPNAPYTMKAQDKKQLASYIESFIKDTSMAGAQFKTMPGFSDIKPGSGKQSFSKYFTTREGLNLKGDPDAEAEMLWSMLKDTGLSLEDFNQGLKDANSRPWVADRRKGIFGRDYQFTPGKHTEAMSMFGETEKEPMTIENTVTDSQGNVTGQDGDPAQYDSPDGTKMSGTLDNTTTTNSAGQTWRTDGETSIALAQQYNTDALREAMGGDLASDAGRAALLAAIDQPLGVMDGYTWDSETGQLTYDMAGMESLLAPGEEATDENLWLSGKKKEDGGVDTKRRSATEEDTMAKALRLRDIATEAYEKATGESITRQGKLQMAEEQAISRKGQKDLDIVKSNAGNYIFKMRGALDSAAKGNLSLLESALAEELPAPPPGLVWNNQSQTFTQRPGFTGRSMDANTQRWMQIAEPTYKMMDRATKVMNEQKKLQMELANSQAAIEESDKRFADAMANDDIETADEILANQRKAETEAITSRTKMEQMTMLMNIVKDPLLLGNAKRYGMLAEMESQLGWATGIISDTVPDVPEGAGIPNYNEWTLMSQEEQIMRKTDWVANGGDLNEFDIMIKSSAPANVQRVDYSIYQETKCHQNYPQYLL